jgi:hypothetical protein
VSGTGDQLVTLDGIDLYERTRLSDEGVGSLQALANHDLLDLFFKTRISPSRLVDWVDQATLQGYLADPGDTRALGRVVKRLRAVGIRTATDFLTATDPGSRNSGAITRLLAVAMGWPKDANGRDHRTRVALLRNAIVCSEWSGRVRFWKGSEFLRTERCQRRYIDGDGHLVAGDPRFADPSGETEEQGDDHPPAQPFSVIWLPGLHSSLGR